MASVSKTAAEIFTKPLSQIKARLLTPGEELKVIDKLIANAEKTKLAGKAAQKGFQKMYHGNNEIPMGPSTGESWDKAIRKESYYRSLVKRRKQLRAKV